MKKLSLLTLLTVLFMCSCTTTQSEKDQLAIAQLDSLFTSLYPADEPGAAILILKGDDIIYDKGFGIADLELGTKIDGNTFFNIASVSKQFTAVGILKLAQEGKLSLDDNVKMYFPEFKADFYKDITIRHLMSHTSGIGDERPRDDMEFVLYATDHETIKYMEDLKSLHFAPGTYYEYMNPTFQLLGAIIEKVSGLSFTEYMHNSIFKPAGMEQTVYFSPDITIPNMSHGYIPIQENETALEDSDRTPEAIAAAKKAQENAPIIGKWRECDYGEETFFATKADGGIYTSTREFVKWEKALRNGTIISKELLAEAHSPKISVSDSPYSNYQRRQFTNYGYGWFIERVPYSFERIFHTGDNGGYQIYAGRYPESNILVLIFENRNDDDRWANVQAIDAIMQKAGWL